MSASLEIHQLNAGQGDATLVVVRDLVKLRNAIVTHSSSGQQTADGMSAIEHLPYCINNNISLVGTVKKALLIDAGNDCYGFSVRYYCESVGALDPSKLAQSDFLTMVTHYHDDHQDGLRGVLRDPDPDNKKKTKEKYRPAEFFRLAKPKTAERGMIALITRELEEQDVTTSLMPSWRTVVRYVPKGGYDKSTSTPWSVQLGTGVSNLPIRVRVFGGDRHVFGGDLGALAVPSKPRGGKKKKTVDENDRSICMVVEYGSFRHFIGGDAGGQDGSAYADVEAKLAPQMENFMPVAIKENGAKFNAAGHCCSFKLNHHGTKYSNDVRFLATVRPRLAVITAGVKLYFHGHPTKDTVARLRQSTWLARDGSTQVPNSLIDGAIVATEFASRSGKGTFNPDPGQKIKVMGDLIIRPVDEDIAAAHLAKNTGTDIRIQVYGNREQTELGSGSKFELRTAEVETNGNYKMTPVVVSCKLH